MLGRDTSRWYLIMHLFHQHRYGEWTEVAADIAATLWQRVEKKRIGPNGQP